MTNAEQQLNTFRKTHQIRNKTIAGKTWFYYTSGVGEQTIVILPGTGAFGAPGAEVMFPLISELEKHFRILSLGYPPDASAVMDIVEGVKGILDEENIHQASFLGHSLGALNALCFLSTYPLRVNSIIIANFAIPTSSNARFMKVVLPVIIGLPKWVTRRVVKSQFRQVMKKYPDDFWRSYLTGKDVNIPFQLIANHYRCMLDFLQNWHISPESFASWHGRALILESDQDQDTPQERANLEALFVNKSTHVFHHAEHLSFITHTKEFAETVIHFLNVQQ
jgi:pimeloyl-ACP methyl ester carboxylesterase